MKCPCCNKPDINPDHDKAIRNTENYGEGLFVFRCYNCKKKYSAYYERQVKVNPPLQEPDFKDLSF